MEFLNSKRLYFFIHILLLIPAYFSPILFNWKLIVLGSLLLQIQYLILGGCVLTHLELGKDKNETFIWYYLQKLYPKLNPKITRYFIRFILPIFLISFAMVIQIYFKVGPLLF